MEIPMQETLSQLPLNEKETLASAGHKSSVHSKRVLRSGSRILGLGRPQQEWPMNPDCREIYLLRIDPPDHANTLGAELANCIYVCRSIEAPCSTLRS